MPTFHEIFQEQKDYNEAIRSQNPEWRLHRHEWAETYLLGLVSEIDDILDSLKWKRHRKGEDPRPLQSNLSNDLADLTKYVLSLWELFGFPADSVLYSVHNKTQVMQELFRQEFEEIPTDRLVVITDLDGTLADWRASFIDWAWAMMNVKMEPIEDGRSSLQLDSDLAMNYPDYFRLKEEFESGGNYSALKIYDDAATFLHWLKNEFQAYFIAHTARPWNRYYRIWGDTWKWIMEHKLPIDQLRVGSESRILLASEIGGENVLMLEDDPGLMLRAAHSGIRVVARKHPYNDGIEHENITFVESLLDAKEKIENDFTAQR